MIFSGLLDALLLKPFRGHLTFNTDPIVLDPWFFILFIPLIVAFRKRLSRSPDRFSFTTALTVASLCDCYRVSYRLIEYFRRVGRSKMRPRNFIEFISLALRLSMLFRPLKLFVPVGVALLLMGLLKLTADVGVAIVKSFPS